MASMPRSTAAVACGAMLALGLVGTARAQTPGFHLIGVAPGASGSGATAVSADGRWVTGHSVLTTFPNTITPFRWSLETGRVDLLSGTSAPTSALAAGINDTGTFIVGEGGFASGVRAYRRDDAAGYQDLGVIGGHETSRARGVSADGSVVVGYCDTFMSFNGLAFRWTPSTGMQSLGFARPGHIKAQAFGVSRDGSTIVGYSQGATADAFVWTASLGMRPLPLLQGAITGQALGTNLDGTRIVGSSGGGDNRRAVVWVGGQVTDLGLVTGWTSSAAYGTSDNGSVVTTIVSSGTDLGTAAVWTPGTGMVLLTEFLATHGQPVPQGWTLGSSFSMSADGRTFVGSVVIPGQLVQGVVITIPSPGALVVCAGMGLRLGLRRRRRSKCVGSNSSDS